MDRSSGFWPQLIKSRGDSPTSPVCTLAVATRPPVRTVAFATRRRVSDYTRAEDLILVSWIELTASRGDLSLKALENTGVVRNLQPYFIVIIKR
jgi:hypothetical protein